jgi:hypothetical protein
MSVSVLGPPERWAKWLGRLAIFAGIPLLLVLVGVGIGTRIQPHRLPLSPARSGTSVNQAEETFATEFITAYLTHQDGALSTWQAQVSPYLAAGVDPSSWWNGQGSEQVAEVLPVSTSGLGQGVDQVTVAALIGGAWSYLGVPVYAAGGSYAVTGPPAMVSAPPVASWSPPAGEAVDSTLSAQLQSNVSAFFAAYAAGNGTQLGYYSTPGAAIRGLDGEVSLGRLVELQVLQGGSSKRTATATVAWNSHGSSTSYQQTYQLSLRYLGGKWLVASVRPASEENS